MADPTADAPAVDEFAQTRGGDDLFDDEIIPVSTEEQVQPETQPQEGTVDKPDEVALSPPTQPRPRSRGGERGRGRGRWRGRGGRKVSKNRRADGGAKDNKLVENTTEAESANVEDSETGQVPEKEDEAGSESKGPAASNGEGQRVPAVRGDRSATGGIKKVSYVFYCMQYARCLLTTSAQTHRRGIVPTHCCRQRKCCQAVRRTCPCRSRSSIVP